MKTDNPAVQRFTQKAIDGQDQVDIYLNSVSEVAIIQTSKWPRDSDGTICDVGQSQTIKISRYALLGLAHDILTHSKE